MKEINETTIYPTGTCFDDALDFLTELVKRSPLRGHTPNLWLVHAICKLPNGEPYSHAWVEQDGMVWFSGILDGEKVYCQAARAEYYVEAQVIDATLYSPFAALKENNRTETYGPWDPKYQALTRQAKEERKSSGS